MRYQDGLRQRFLAFVKASFPEAVPLAEEQCIYIESLEQFQDLILLIGLSRDVEQVRHHVRRVSTYRPVEKEAASEKAKRQCGARPVASVG